MWWAPTAKPTRPGSGFTAFASVARTSRGLISAGTFHSHGHWVFWDVHDPEKAIGIQLRDERYGKLIAEVADPDEVIDRIRGATG